MTSATWMNRRAEPSSRGLVLTLVCASQFLVILDAAIVNVALPSVDRDLGFTTTGLAWVVNGYLLTFAGFLLLGGRAADLFGIRQILVVGLLLFSMASLAAGLAPTAGVLVAARLVQGFGAALLAPATLAVINTYFDGPGRVRAFGAWSAAGGVGGMAGALVGGALTSGLSWRWVFLINLPVGIALVVVAMRSLRNNRPGVRTSLDLAGAVTATAGAAALIYGLMQAPAHGWVAVQALAPVGAGTAMLVLFVAIEGRLSTDPMLPVRLVRLPGVATGCGLLFLFGSIAIAMWYFTSLLLQHVLGYNALETGLAQTPAAVAFVVVAQLTSGFSSRVERHQLVLAGCGFFLVGFGWLAFVSENSAYVPAVLVPTLLIASGIGLVFPTLMAAATAGANEGDAGIVGGLATTVQQIGGAVGLAVLTTASASRTFQDSDHESAVALAAGYQLAFLIAAGLAVVIALGSVLLPRSGRI